MASDPRTEFGILTPDGFTRQGTLRQADMLACPWVIIDFAHYRADGSCKCDTLQERARLISHYGYVETDFDAIPLRAD